MRYGIDFARCPGATFPTEWTGEAISHSDVRMPCFESNVQATIKRAVKQYRRRKGASRVR
jgi:hypothetical protein